MAEKKISDLTPKTGINDADEFVFVDKATTSGDDASTSGQTSKIAFSDLKTAVGTSGPQGAPGQNSTVAGPQGAPGQNSTVAGPQGLTGAQGKQGANGNNSTVAGPQGNQGFQGLTGASGSPWSGGTFTGNIKVEGNMESTGTFGNDRFFQAGSITYLHSGSENETHMIRFSHDNASGSFTIFNNPVIQGHKASDSENYLYFAMANKMNTKKDWFKFSGDKMWLHQPVHSGTGNPAELYMTAKTSSGAASDWSFQAWNDDEPGSSGKRNLVITPVSNPAGGGLVQFGRDNRSTNVYVWGDLEATNKKFRIKHPILENKDLMHSSVEAPRSDLIYRGVYKLGTEPVNLDKTANMTEGTFVSLVRDAQIFVNNNKSWDKVRGRVEGNLLYIECENNESSEQVDWMVIGERKDETYINSDSVDSSGKFITEADPVGSMESVSNLNVPSSESIDIISSE